MLAIHLDDEAPSRVLTSQSPPAAHAAYIHDPALSPLESRDQPLVCLADSHVHQRAAIPFSVKKGRARVLFFFLYPIPPRAHSYTTAACCVLYLL
jgi:hypothetical protein